MKNMLQFHREQAGLTMTEAAYKVGLGYSTWATIEGGFAKSYPKFRRAAAEALSITEDRIFDDKGWIRPFEPQTAA